jgi:hypothetical protein
MTGTPRRSQRSIVLNPAWSTICVENPSDLAALVRFAPVVPLSERDRHNPAIRLSETVAPKYVETIFRHAGPHIAVLCLKFMVLRMLAGCKRLARRSFVFNAVKAFGFAPLVVLRAMSKCDAVTEPYQGLNAFLGMFYKII